MPPTNLTPQTNDRSTPEWFQETLSPLPPPAPKPKRLWRLVIAMFFAVMLIVGGITYIARSTQHQLCLTRDDFRDLTGKEYYEGDAFTPSSSFYTYNFEFLPTSTEYAVNGEQTGAEIAQHIGKFYKANPGKSILIAISSDFRGNETPETAHSRIDKVVNHLTEAGIPDDTIVASTPVYLDAQDDVATSEPEAPTASIGLYSAQSCTQ